MRTARNIFIATLGVADSALCLVTMPMTLLGILTKYWPFGPQTWLLCKVMRTSPAVTVFFSAYTMAIIAIDRHRFIVHSTKRQVKIFFQYLQEFFLFKCLGFSSFNALQKSDFKVHFNRKLPIHSNQSNFGKVHYEFYGSNKCRFSAFVKQQQKCVCPLTLWSPSAAFVDLEISRCF